MNAAQRDQLAASVDGFFGDLRAFLAQTLPPAAATSDLLSSVESLHTDFAIYVRGLPIDGPAPSEAEG